LSCTRVFARSRSPEESGQDPRSGDFANALYELIDITPKGVAISGPSSHHGTKRVQLEVPRARRDTSAP
jgi:predicted dithiol-disulfide oxidoreductase (DUF899 family)